MRIKRRNEGEKEAQKRQNRTYTCLTKFGGFNLDFFDTSPFSENEVVFICFAA